MICLLPLDVLLGLFWNPNTQRIQFDCICPEFNSYQTRSADGQVAPHFSFQVVGETHHMVGAYSHKAAHAKYQCKTNQIMAKAQQFHTIS